MSLVAFILACYGATGIVTWGRIFDKIRPSHEFFHCPQCIGFWVGLGLAFLWWPPQYVAPKVWPIVGALISSGTSYMLASLINDGGLQHEHGYDEVDVATSPPVLSGEVDRAGDARVE